MAKKTKEKEAVGGDNLKKLENKYGVRKAIINPYSIVSTGSIQLDRAMGIGGTAVGKIYEIFGPESSGKSTLTLHQIAEYQKAFPNKKVALFDYEFTYSKNYSDAIGVDFDRLEVYQPDTQESGYDLLIEAVKEDIFSCIVIDSQTAAPPKAILEGEMGDSTIGLQARNNSKFFLKVKGLLDVHQCSLIVISQTRASIGGYSEAVTTGGNALKFYADARWKIWKMNDKDNELNKTTVDVVKNKLSKPFGQAVFKILWGQGIDKLGEIIDYAIEFGFITRAGGWYTIGEHKAQGIDGIKDLFDEYPDVLVDIHERVMNKLDGKNEVYTELDENYDSEVQENS